MITVNDKCHVKTVKPIANMGRESYNLYLFHWPVRTVCAYIFDNPWIVFLLTLVLTLIANKCYITLEYIVKTRWAARFKR